ncbi:hypothetical protein ACROYT_G015081 [Oculina patagonica]
MRSLESLGLKPDDNPSLSMVLLPIFDTKLPCELKEKWEVNGDFNHDFENDDDFDENKDTHGESICQTNLFVWKCPSELSQSTLDGVNGSSACSIIALIKAMAYEVSILICKQRLCYVHFGLCFSMLQSELETEGHQFDVSYSIAVKIAHPVRAKALVQQNGQQIQIAAALAKSQGQHVETTAGVAGVDQQQSSVETSHSLSTLSFYQAWCKYNNKGRITEAAQPYQLETRPSEEEETIKENNDVKICIRSLRRGVGSMDYIHGLPIMEDDLDDEPSNNSDITPTAGTSTEKQVTSIEGELLVPHLVLLGAAPYHGASVACAKSCNRTLKINVVLKGDVLPYTVGFPSYVWTLMCFSWPSETVLYQK